jgi:hypothetical protein
MTVVDAINSALQIRYSGAVAGDVFQVNSDGLFTVVFTATNTDTSGALVFVNPQLYIHINTDKYYGATIAPSSPPFFINPTFSTQTYPPGYTVSWTALPAAQLGAGQSTQLSVTFLLTLHNGLPNQPFYLSYWVQSNFSIQVPQVSKEQNLLCTNEGQEIVIDPAH